MKNNMCSSVVMLSRSHLHPHPDNPRKNLGDLDELRESIREHGVMQNLTVIPVDDNFEDFTILIGHRRFAASEGILTELPCVIVEDLSDREQIGIMLCENLQRNDLTFIEQAHGFQMMMDLGDTVESISEKTGFSTTTVRHRLEIAKLDKKMIEKVEADNSWQIGIKDYIELEKIDDLDDRAEILADSIDSDDLHHNINRYLRDMEHERNTSKLTELFNSLGCKEVKNNVNYSDKYDVLHFGTDRRSWISIDDTIDFEELKTAIEKKQAKKKEVVYQISYSVVYVATVNNIKEKKKTKQDLERERLQNNEKQLEEARKQICSEFAKCIADIDLDRFRNMETEKTRFKQMVVDLWGIAEKIELCLYGYQISQKSSDSICKDALTPLFEKYDELHLLQKIMTRILTKLSSKHGYDFCNWNNTPYRKHLENFESFYEVLYFFGMRLNDEFRDIIEGSSDLYEPDDEEEA